MSLVRGFQAKLWGLEKQSPSGLQAGIIPSQPLGCLPAETAVQSLRMRVVKGRKRKGRGGGGGSMRSARQDWQTHLCRSPPVMGNMTERAGVQSESFLARSPMLELQQDPFHWSSNSAYPFVSAPAIVWGTV